MRRVVLRSVAAAMTPSAATTLLSTPPLFLRRASSSSSAQTDSLNEQTLRDAADAAVQVAAVERALRKRAGCPDADAAAAEKVDVPATAAEDEAAPLVLLGGDEAAAGAAETEAVPSSEGEAQDDMAYALRRASDLRALHERRALAVGKRARALLELEMLCLVEGKVDVAAVAARIAAEEAAEKEEGKEKEEEEEVDEGELFFGLDGDEHGAGASVEEAAQRAREHELQRGCDQGNQRRNPAASAAKLQKTFRMRSQAGRVEDNEMYMREDRGGTVETLEATASLAGKTTRGRRAEYSSTLDIESVLEQAAHQSKRSDDEEASKLRFMTDVVVPNLETELRGKFPQASPELIHKLALELAEKRLAKTRDNIGGGMW